MVSKWHKRNTNFQILTFIVGSCYTYDGAYFILKDLKEEREMSLESFKVGTLRNKIKVLELKIKMESATDPIEKLRIEADLLEIAYGNSRSKELLDATLDELNYINDLLKKVHLNRSYAHLSDIQANEASQREEWKFELLERAANHLVLTGTIPPDEFVTMKKHPDFLTEIFPVILNIKSCIASRGNMDQFLMVKPILLLEE